jgi:DNA (cytosine-5)-methyltransferase 1
MTREHQALVQGKAFIIPFFGERDGQEPRVHSIDDPLPTVTGHGAGAIVQPFIIPVNHGDAPNRHHSIDDPMPTITSVDAWALIDSWLIKYYGTAGARSVDEPLDTVTTKDRYALIQSYLNSQGIQAQGFAILDIRFRMLQPHELAAAMSFPKTYIFTGNREAQVKQIGNAVAVRTAKALCRSMLEAA